jgi:hypothetical protein
MQDNTSYPKAAVKPQHNQVYFRLFHINIYYSQLPFELGVESKPIVF